MSDIDKSVWACVGAALAVGLLMLAGAAQAQTYTEITTGVFDPLPETAPFEQYVAPGAGLEPLCPYCAEPRQIEPYDDILIQTAPGQIQSEDGYRIWVAPPTIDPQ